MGLATKLIALRKQKGMTQMELAEKLNVSRQAISRWEVGAADPSIENLKALAKVYGVQIDSLLNEDAPDAAGPDAPESPVAEQSPVPQKPGGREVLICVLAAAMVLLTLLWAGHSLKPDVSDDQAVTEVYPGSIVTYEENAAVSE